MRLTFTLLALLALPALAQAQSSDGRVQKIRDSKTVVIAYRTDALPFSFEENKEPRGYTVDLCRRIVASMEQQLGISPLQVKWVAATSENRMDLVRNNEADMECGATTATLGRMEQVDFSNPVFVDATGLLVRKAAGASSLAGLQGKKIAVITGTTNQKALDAALKRRVISATVTPVASRDEGIAALEAGTVDAFAGDKLLLAALAGKVKDRSLYEILADDLSFEPYAIVLPRNDSSFRLAVNRGLAQIYRGSAIVDVFRRNFGPNIAPSPALEILYGLNAYPE
jgi:ABC-type amino acid transport substrate-binding protein